MAGRTYEINVLSKSKSNIFLSLKKTLLKLEFFLFQGICLFLSKPANLKYKNIDAIQNNTY